MQFKENSVVRTAAGERVGNVTHFVIDPRSNEVTHLVVEKGFLFKEDRVIPIHAINTSEGDEIYLNPDAGKPEDFPPFEETYYVRPEEYSTDPNFYPTLSSYYYYPSLNMPDWGAQMTLNPPVSTVPSDDIPPHTVAVREGADVYSSDDKLIGQVDQVFTASDSSHITHFVIGQGLLLKSHKLVPVHWIDSMSADRVDLATTERVIEQLPNYNPN